MWMCPKCSKQISDGSKICRQCGSILEEAEDNGPTEKDPQSDLSGQLGQVLVTDEKKPSQVDPDSTTDPSERGDNDLQVHEDQYQSEQAKAVLWTCRKCGENVPGNFKVCWKCGTTKEGLEDADFVTELPDGDESVQPEVASNFEGLTESEVVSRCAKCGSARIIPGVRLIDQGQGSDGASKVVVFGNPDALVFKDRRYGEVKADICGECGHIELRVSNPRELYEHYIESLDE